MALLFQLLIEYPKKPYCQTLQLPTSRDNYYVLPDGVRLHLDYAPAWCARCASFVPGESIETPDEVDQRIHELSAWDSTKQTVIDLQNLERRKQWVLARRSPPRCLRCFTPGAIMLPLGRKIPHPQGLGWVTAEVMGFAGPLASGQWILTAEGEPTRPEARD